MDDETAPPRAIAEAESTTPLSSPRLADAAADEVEAAPPNEAAGTMLPPGDPEPLENPELAPATQASPPPDPPGDPEPLADPEPPGDPEPPAAERDLAERLAAAERRGDELVAVAARQSALADELHAANQALRDGELRLALAPLIRGIARLAEDVDTIRAARREDEDLAHLERRVHEVLHDAGVSLLAPQPGDAFDPTAHQATGTAPTDDPAQARTVAEVRRAGLVRDDGHVLRPAAVVVFRPAPSSPKD